MVIKRQVDCAVTAADSNSGCIVPVGGIRGIAVSEAYPRAVSCTARRPTQTVPCSIIKSNVLISIIGFNALAEDREITTGPVTAAYGCLHLLFQNQLDRLLLH